MNSIIEAQIELKEQEDILLRNIIKEKFNNVFKRITENVHKHSTPLEGVADRNNLIVKVYK